MKSFVLILKILRKAYQCVFQGKIEQYCKIVDFNYNVETTNELLRQMIYSGKPFMVARIGATELLALENYLSVSEGINIKEFIKGNKASWWWEDGVFNQMEQWSGFFPANINTISRFGELMIEDLKSIDVLAEWKASYKHILHLLPDNCKISHLFCVEPFASENPWTYALKGKKVLIVHPFAELISNQYDEKRNLLFANKEMLPEFDLITIKAVQSLGGKSNNFKDWFEALDWMINKINEIDFDICLLGCGAYGLPLAAHVKRIGKQAIHLGGSLQLLFGIIGSRWTNPFYGVNEWHIPIESYSSLINDYWVRPGDNNKTQNYLKVENGCYW